MVDRNYDPSTAAAPPTSDQSPDVDQYIKDWILAAKAAAPSFLTSRLCNLDGFFITQKPTSWGLRITKPADGTPGRYIAISLSLWVNQQPMLLLDYYNDQLDSILPQLQSDPNPPEYTSVTPNDRTTTLVSVMSHEYGHILWSDILTNPPGSTPAYQNFCPGAFPFLAWTDASDATRFRKLRVQTTDTAAIVSDDPNYNNDPNDVSDGSADDPSYKDVSVQKLLDIENKPHPNYLKGRKIINRLLREYRPWPSLFGAFSANEDFVETFTLYTLRHLQTKLSSLQLTIPMKNPVKTAIKDVPATVNSRSALSAKLLCFDDWFARNPTTDLGSTSIPSP